jgi:hypothetical protein
MAPANNLSVTGIKGCDGPHTSRGREKSCAVIRKFLFERS